SVLELISNDAKGLRLPQLSTAERDIMTATDEFIAEKTGKARGLQIFNTTTYCVETWNGAKWIEKCMSCEGISFPSLGKAYSLCNGAIVSDLSAKIGGADIYEFAEGGNKRSSGDALYNGTTYYAEQRVANCAAPARTPVTVNLGNCSDAVSSASITTFVNVMYDFQHQTLEAYNTGGIATDYTWQVSTSNSSSDSDFSNILDAPNSAFYTVPAHYADAYPTGTELFFRCIIKNPVTATPLKTGNLGIIFIKTNTAGYGIDEATGVRYLTLQKGENGTVKGGTMKVALLNLGQSADWTLAGGYVPNNDAGDLGDFYQWGRVADGHQNVVWSKNSSHNNTIEPVGATPANTSSSVSRGGTAANIYDSNGQIKNTATAYYGRFIKGYSDWHVSIDNSLWGDRISSTRASDISLSDWKYPLNNPCPAGSHIPSRLNWWDLYRGNGDDIPTSSSGFGSATDNKWQWVGKNGTNNTAYGGAIITNAAGEKIFLCAASFRLGSDGMLFDTNGTARHWSSTCYGDDSAFNLYFNADTVDIGSIGGNSKAHGFCVRCVAE
ncbi:MAG: hypothetical protein LBB53_03505, partial [Prevotellaceae bacterium]|nr:hypothetical protein [Prevotellaceae bacterium]